MNKYPLIKAVILGLMLMNMSIVSAKSLHNQDTKCSSMAYISIKRDVALLEKPDSVYSNVIMNLHGGQFVCVVSPKPIRVLLGHSVPTYWVLVRKVPTDELEGTKAKALVHDYPTPWIATKPKGDACHLKAEYVSSGNDYVYTKGVCATGYVRTSTLHLLDPYSVN